MIDNLMTNIDSTENLIPSNFRWVSNSRYYSINIQLDLFGRISVTKSWGSRTANTGGHQIITCDSIVEAVKTVKQVAVRRKQRGYEVTY